MGTPFPLLGSSVRFAVDYSAVLNPIVAEHQNKPTPHHRVGCINYPYTVIPQEPSKITSFPRNSPEIVLWGLHFLHRVGYSISG
jgi:hypothetical protein